MAEPPVTDAQLIARALVADDRHAFAELVKRHQSSVRACLRKLTAGNHALADDLAQETFVLAWRNLKSFRQEARFSTWLGLVLLFVGVGYVVLWFFEDRQAGERTANPVPSPGPGDTRN